MNILIGIKRKYFNFLQCTTFSPREKGKAYEKVLQCQGLCQTAHQMQPGCHIPISESQGILFSLTSNVYTEGTDHASKLSHSTLQAKEGAAIQLGMCQCLFLCDLSMSAASINCSIARLLWLLRELGQASLTDT